jgi:Leucine-rich repeat (LRR) protein
LRLIDKFRPLKKLFTLLSYISGLLPFTCFINTCAHAQVQVDTAFLMQQKEYHELDEAMKQPDSVYILNLSREKLTSFPEEIFQLKNLRILDISHNKIKEIPASIGTLVHLNGLDISNNKISSIPSSIGNMHDLISLKLNRNIIDSIPPEIGNLKNLEVLELWDNEIHFIPDEIKGLYNLKVLELRGILFNEEEQQRIKGLLPEANVYLSPSCNCKY